MKAISQVVKRAVHVTKAVTRFPVSTGFFIMSAVWIGITIQYETKHMREILASLVGALVGMVLVLLEEHYFSKNKTRWPRLIAFGIGVCLTVVYYFLLGLTTDESPEKIIRTSVLLLGILVFFIKIPSIKQVITFPQSFMVIFKSIFQALFFGAVIFFGMTILMQAVDTLIIAVNEKVYPHMLNIVAVVFVPLYFISLIPVFEPYTENTDRAEQQKEEIKKAVHCPRFFDILLSYIIIPIVSLFSLILVIYIVKTIRGSFWTDNLLEPMIVAYAVTVIVVFLLSVELNNKITNIFCKNCGKILIPLVIVQIIATGIRLNEVGMVHTRYFVLMFGCFAVLSGVVMGFLPRSKTGIIGSLFVLMTLVTVLPPLDAFSVSKRSQISRLEGILTANDMLKDGSVVAVTDLSNEDKKGIAYGINYLYVMDYLTDVPWIPDDFLMYEDFNKTFGFDEYEGIQRENNYLSIFLKQDGPVMISDYDLMNHSFVNSQDNDTRVLLKWEESGENYRVEWMDEKKEEAFLLYNSKNEELLRVDLSEIQKRFQGYAADKKELTQSEATFQKENDNFRMSIVVNDMGMDTRSGSDYIYIDLFILIQIK